MKKNLILKSITKKNLEVMQQPISLFDKKNTLNEIVTKNGLYLVFNNINESHLEVSSYINNLYGEEGFFVILDWNCPTTFKKEEEIADYINKLDVLSDNIQNQVLYKTIDN